MTRGETIKVTIDYDLFGHNVNGSYGIYLKTDSKTKKHLIYFPEHKEWGELFSDQLSRRRPDFVPKKNKEFVSLVKTLGS